MSISFDTQEMYSGVYDGFPQLHPPLARIAKWSSEACSWHLTISKCKTVVVN